MNPITMIVVLFLFTLVVPAFPQSSDSEPKEKPEGFIQELDKAFKDFHSEFVELGNVNKGIFESSKPNKSSPTETTPTPCITEECCEYPEEMLCTLPRNVCEKEGIMVFEPSLNEELAQAHREWCAKFKQEHSKNFKDSVTLVGLSMLAYIKTMGLLRMENDIVIVEGSRPISSKHERGKHQPKCSPHVLGYAIDLRPGSIDGQKTTWRSKNYDRQKTQAIVDMVRYIDPCARLLFNDPEIRGVEYYDDHDHHIHVSWSLNPIPKAAQRQIAARPWSW